MNDLRKVYFDFQDGTGFQDVSAIVKYDTFTINMSAFNDTYHYSQNTCSFDAIYNDTFTPLILSTDKNIIVRIVDWSTETMLTAESNWLLTTEDAFYLVAEQGIATPVFYGQIKPTRSRSYNGILNNTILSLEATDELDLLDKEVGDIILTNCKILDPANPTASIVHILAGIAGFTNISANTTIDVTIAKFAPEKETESILTILDTLLYEYGYVLNINGYGVLEPIKWVYDAIPTQVSSFDEDSIISSVTIKDTIQNYDGSKIIYYELGSASKVLLYRDDNCGYNDDSTFAGYNIYAGSSYPPETNVIDETTGLPTVVYQEYTDDSIKYWTNKAIKNNLDYNYKAFSSDFSAIVATEKHFMDVRYSTGIVATTPEFYNKKCRLLYNNPTADSGLKLYYNNVYGDVWYKSAERTATVDNVLEPNNRYEYTASYIFDKIHADVLVKTYAAQYAGHRTVYTFPSEEKVLVGTLVTIVLEDGTNQLCIVQNRSWDEHSEYYNYTLMSYSITKPTLTSQTVSTTATVNPSYTYAVISTIGTPVAAANSSPAYRGIGILSSAGSATFSGATVNESGVITTTIVVNANIGDWMINYASTYLAIGMYVWDGSTAAWKTTNDVDYVSAASIDLCNLQVGGITVSGFTTFITAIVKTLFAQQITMVGSGVIQSNAYPSGMGYHLDSNGKISSLNSSKEVRISNGEIDIYGGSSGTIESPSANSPLLSLYDGNVYSKMYFSGAWQSIFNTRTKTTVYNDITYENSSIKGKGFYTKRCLVGGNDWHDTALKVYPGCHYKLYCSGCLITGTGDGTWMQYTYEFLIGSGYLGAYNTVVIGGYNDGGLSSSVMLSELISITGSGLPGISLRAGSHAPTTLYRNMMYCDITRVCPLDKIGVDFGEFPIITYEEY